MSAPDLVLVDGNVVTVDADFSLAEAVAVTEGRITAVGDTADVLALCDADTQVVDLAGRTLLPGFVEAHGHPTAEMHLIGPDSKEVDAGSVDWNSITAENFPYRLRQDPGRLNALGQMKFMFPNRYDVYLHDTPSRQLFEETQRDFSHGCIRIEKPTDLAVYLMKKSKWNQEAIERALDEGTERSIYLPRPIPIHLLYFTAWADEDGTIQFREDINGVDPPLSRALAKKD